METSKKELYVSYSFLLSKNISQNTIDNWRKRGLSIVKKNRY